MENGPMTGRQRPKINVELRPGQWTYFQGSNNDGSFETKNHRREARGQPGKRPPVARTGDAAREARGADECAQARPALPDAGAPALAGDDGVRRGCGAGAAGMDGERFRRSKRLADFRAPSHAERFPSSESS
jgi:hypothetical protein